MEIDLNEVAVFIKVVELGSFSKAAQSLGMPNSTVSAKVSDLETRLGVSLMKRTTRKLFVTEEGRSFYERCTRGLEEIRAAEEELVSGQREPQGLLRVTAPIDLGSVVLTEVIEALKRKHPKIHIELFLSDRTVDLIAEGFDLAIRAGPLKDSSLMAKKLGAVYFAPFASPQYLKKQGTPQSPKELRDHCLLQFTPLGVDEWRLNSPKTSVNVPLSKQLIVNELHVLKNLTVSGVGISLLPTYLCLPEVQSGRLLRILPEWRSNLMPVHFIYPGQKHLSPKVKAFIEVATELIQKNLKALEA